MAVEGDELRRDHLSPYARSQHRNLLIAASVGFVFVALQPQRISTLGIEVESSRRGWLLSILLAAILYFEFAFFAGSRADYHVWRRGLSEQRAHLDVLSDESEFERRLEDIDAHLDAGEDAPEIARRMHELEAAQEQQRATRRHLDHIVRSFWVRGLVDFWLAPLYGAAVFCVLLYQLVRQLM